MTNPNFEPGDQCDSSDIVCPYCGSKRQAESDFNDYDEYKQEEECGECGKTFIRWASITVDFYTMQKPEETKP